MTGQLAGHGLPRVIAPRSAWPVAWDPEPIPPGQFPSRCWAAVADAVLLLSAHLAADDGVEAGNIVDLVGAKSGTMESRGIIWALLTVTAAAFRGFEPGQARAVLAALGAAAAAEGREP